VIFFLEKKISPLKRPFFKFLDTKNNSCKKSEKTTQNKKNALSSQKYGGIRDKPIPDPGSRIRGAKRYRIPDPGFGTLVKSVNFSRNGEH
jgi:hypothetical protein